MAAHAPHIEEEVTMAIRREEEQELEVHGRCLRVQLEHGARMPVKAYDTDAGFDLHAYNLIIRGNAPVVIDTGVHIELPADLVGLVLPRSSTNRQGITCPPGVIDPGYTGTIKVVAWAFNGGSLDGVIERGQRIAQLVILPLPKLRLIEATPMQVTGKRGDNGFGSTGF